MRLRVTRDGRSEEVEVAADLSSVTISGRTFPVTVVRAEAMRVEIEIAGERVLVENWPEHFPEPPSPVDVNGERAPVALERLSIPSPETVVPVRCAPAVSRALGTPPVPPASGGTPIVPPMPGKVVELRVSEGQWVDAGAVVLVLEAMKMRNEVTSPVAGVVRALRVGVGANVRAREPMLFVEPS